MKLEKWAEARSRTPSQESEFYPVGNRGPWRSWNEGREVS